MKRLLFLSVIGTAAVSLAQTGGGAGSLPLQQVYFSTADNPTVANGTYTFGPSECSSTLTVNWQNTVTQQLFGSCSSNSMQVWVTNGSCGTEPVSGDLELSDIPGATLQGIRYGTFTIELSKLPGFSTASDGGTYTCGATGFTQTYKVCGALVYTPYTGTYCGTSNTLKAAALTIVYDTQPPDPPTISTVAAQDQALKITFSTASDTETLIAQVREANSGGAFVEKGTALATSGFVLAKGLVNYTDYEVQLIALDAAGNRSPPSASETGRPIEVCGLLCLYKTAGGTDEPRGCATQLVTMPALALLWALRRREKKSKRSQS